MADIVANAGDISMAVAEEQSPSVLIGDTSGHDRTDNVWRQLELNTLTRFGSRFTLGVPDIISPELQREPGSPQSADTQVQFRTYSSIDVYGLFVSAITSGIGAREDAVNMDATGVTASAVTGLAALSAGQIAAFPANGLVMIAGSNAGNNGVFPVTSAPAASDTEIDISGGTVEAGNANLRVSAGGIRAPANTAGLAWNYDANTDTAELSYTGHGAVAAGLQVGAPVFIGSKDPATGGVRNGLTNISANDMAGLCWVKSIDTNSIVFEKLDARLKFDDAAVPTALDILFSDFHRNYNSRSNQFRRRTFQFEGDILVDTTSFFRYIKGCRLNTANIAFPDAQFSTIDWTFIGASAESNVANADRKSVADMYINPILRQINNSGRGINRVELEVEGLTGDLIDFVSGNINITRNLGGANRLGTFGQAYAADGIYTVTLPFQAYVVNDGISQAVENNWNANMLISTSSIDGITAHRIREGKLEETGFNIQTGNPLVQNIQVNSHRDPSLSTSYTVGFIRTDLTGIAGQA